MLDEEQRAAIKAEEYFRDEIRKEIATREMPRSRGSKLWDALNSSFFLWCMSSVVLSTVAFLYQQVAADREARAAQTATIRRLDAEISTRLGYFASQVTTGISEKTALVALNLPATVHLSNSAFSEYAPRTLRMLFLELRELVPAEEQHQIDAAVKSLSILTAIEFLEDSERSLSTDVTLEINIRALDKEVADFFADLDAASTTIEKRGAEEETDAKPVAPEPPAYANEVPPDIDEKAITDDLLRNTARGTTTDGHRPKEPVYASLDINVFNDDPNYRRTTTIHQIAFDMKNPVVTALNIKRWGFPFDSNTAELLAGVSSQPAAPRR